MEIITGSSKNLEIMIRFLAGNSGVVRFDRYMQEHLYGQDGYYIKNARIGSGDFGTESFRSAFAHLVFLDLQQQGLDGKDFLELGGGTGVFKGNYLRHSPKTNYISADISEKFASMQAQVNCNAIISDAAALGLQSGSIDGIIFSNELIDALPCRVFRLTRENGRIRINEEAYIRTNGDALSFEFADAERDDFLETYEMFLNQGAHTVHDGDVISVAPKSIDVIREAMRVLKSGKIIFIDYGFGQRIGCEKTSQELPHIMKRDDYDDSSDIDKILANPYSTDINHSVDFEFLKWVAGQVSHGTKADYRPQVTLLSVLPEYYNQEQIPKPYDHFDRISCFLVLEISK